MVVSFSLVNYVDERPCWPIPGVSKLSGEGARFYMVKRVGANLG